MLPEDIERVARDFGQAMRQWQMYWEMQESEDIETSRAAEAIIYRECQLSLALIKLRIR